MRHSLTIATLLFCLAACGGSGGGGGIDPRLTRLETYDAQRQRVLGDAGSGVPAMTATTAENVPTGGTMSLNGYGTLRVETGEAPLLLSGDAQLAVNFDQGAATGDLTNVFGTTPSETIADYNGAVDFQSATAGQDMVLSYAGNLQADGINLALDGEMTAILLGNPASALTASDLEAVVQQNGAAQDAAFVIVLEGAPP